MRLNIPGKKFVVTLKAFDSDGKMITVDFESSEAAEDFANNLELEIFNIEGRHIDCEACKGKGYIEHTRYHKDGSNVENFPCLVCRKQ